MRREEENVDEQHQYFFLEKDTHGEVFIRTLDEVCVLPLDSEGQVLFAVEPAPAFERVPALVLPGGTVEPGEAFHQTANRELQEELGFRAEELTYLGEVRPWPKYLAVRTHLFLGRTLVPSKLPGDEAEPVGLRRVALNEIDALVADGQLLDARALAAIYLARATLADNG